MITKKFKPLRLMYKAAAKDLKLPTIKLNKSKLGLKPEDGHLKLRTPTVKLYKSKLGIKQADRHLKLRTPTVTVNKSKLGLKPEDGHLKLRTPTVKLQCVPPHLHSQNSFKLARGVISNKLGQLFNT